MAIHKMAQDDFDRAVLKAFWRRVVAQFTGKDNDLLPFDEVRQRLPLKGQHYAGLQVVSIDKIVGSLGRYNDFDRAFLPKQTRTKDRWVNIDKAHYEQVSLPAVDLYKLGDIYFVKDGNHRISVARERGQEFIDAHVTEIIVPVPLTVDTKVDDLILKQEYAIFIETTQIQELRPQGQFETAIAGQYTRLLEHIAVHRWYLGEKRGEEVPYPEAVASWYDNVYLPLILALREHEIVAEFPTLTEMDLYLWIMEYQAYLREVYRDESVEEDPKTLVAAQMLKSQPASVVRKVSKLLKRSAWLDEMIVEQEMAVFYEKAGLQTLRPEASIRVTIPGRGEKLLEHIAVHRWYLGEQRQAEVPYPEAVAAWYDHIYLPLVTIIREQGVLAKFPGRTETDLYLWVIEHQWYLQEEYGDDVPIQKAAEQFAEDFGKAEKKRPSGK